MVAQGIVKNLSAKDLSSQMDGIETVKTLIKQFTVSNEPQLIELIPYLLET